MRPAIVYLSLPLLMFGQRTIPRSLRDLGVIELPKRLEPRGINDQPHDATFVFDHIYDSFFMMGSNTPVSEKLVLVFSIPSADPASVLSRAKTAADRTQVTSWRQDGPYLIGEGIHEVNNAKHSAWVVIRKSDAQHVTAGYMRWQKQASLAECKATLDQALSTLRLNRPLTEYLRLAQDRPARIAKQRPTVSANSSAPRPCRSRSMDPCWNQEASTTLCKPTTGGVHASMPWRCSAIAPAVVTGSSTPVPLAASRTCRRPARSAGMAPRGSPNAAISSPALSPPS